MKKELTIAVAVAAIAMTNFSNAAANDLEVALGLAWVNGGNVDSPVLNAKASNNVTPALSLTYHVTDHFAISSVAGISRHKFRNSTGDLGKASIIPVNLTAQYRFNPVSNFEPYIGAGFNYTIYVHQTGALGDLKDIDPSFGPVLQLGTNVKLNDRWFANIDYRRFWIRPDLEAKGVGKIEQIDLDPDVVTLSVGMKF
jgi:outer membrane protein